MAPMMRPASPALAKTSDGHPRARPVLIVAGLNLLLIWATTIGLAWRGYRDDVGEWKAIADNSSVVTAAYVQQALSAADLVLKSIQDWVADENIETDSQMRQIMGERRFYDAMRARIVGLPQAIVAGIADGTGDILNTTHSYPAPPLNISGSESFIDPMATEEPKLAVSALRRGRATQQWTFYLARRVTAPSGESLGVVSIGLGHEFFSNFFRQVALHSGETISLFRTDGSLLATTNPDPALMGRRFPDAVPVRMALQHPSGVAEVVDEPRWSDPADRRTRIVAPRKVEGLPLLVSTTVGQEVYLAQWWSRTYVIAAIAIVLSGFTILVAILFLRFIARLEKANRLAAERRLFATLLDTPAALCAVLDGRGRMLYCNDRFANLVAAGADPADAFSDPALEGAGAVLHYATSGSANAAEFDLRLERPGAATRFLHVSMSRQMLPDLGECAILVGHDETERHQARAAIAQSAKMVTLGEMTTGMAHELSQPLNVMRMAAQNALAEIPSTEGGAAEPADASTMTEPEFRSFVAGKLNRIVAQVDRAADIVSRMRIFGRAPQGPVATFDVRDACRSAISLVDARLRSISISIRQNLGDEPLPVDGYQSLIEQVLINLLLNARDALKDAARSEGLIEVSATRSAEGRVLVTVSDNGPGVPPAIRDRIFEPFYTAKPLGEGTGLGLALSFGIIRDAGGSLSLLPGTTGARFQIDLPASAG